MIRANIETEIAPIVGSREQAEDLIAVSYTHLDVYKRQVYVPAGIPDAIASVKDALSGMIK